MKRTALLATVVACLGIGVPAAAQTVLPLSQIIDEAITRNPSLAASRAAARQAGAERRVMRAEWLPRFAFT